MRTLNQMKETFKINHENNTIEMTKQFAKASGKYNSEEYKLLMKMKKDLPNYDVIVEEPNSKKPRDNYKGLTYDYMERYIKDKPNHEDILKEFNELRGISTEYEAIMKKTSYLKVKKWFLTTFPEIDEYKQERKETWKVIDKNAKELKEQKAKNENENKNNENNENENNENNENTALNVPAVMINTANTTTLMS